MSWSGPRLNHYRVRDALTSVGLFLALFAVVHFVAWTEQSRAVQDLRARITETVAALRTHLEAELNANVFLANGLAAHVIAVPDPEDQTIETALRTLYRLGNHIRNVGIAPGNRLTHVYPLEGNEAAIGLYYPDLPDQWPAVRRAMETQSPVLAGPVALQQGGSGLISRTPVVLDDDAYWGIVSLVLDAESLFKTVGLAPLRDGVRYALKGRDGKGEDGAMILGAPEVFDSDPVKVSVPVPGGQWVLAAVPVNGWTAGGSLVFRIYLIGLALGAGLAILTYLFLRKRVLLEVSEHRARAFLETTRDGVIVIGDDGIIREFNSGAGEMLGYSPPEVIGASVNRLMFPGTAETHDRYMGNAKIEAARTMGWRRDVIGRRKDGAAVPIEVMVSETEYGGERLHVGVLRDITDRKALEDQLRKQADTDGLTGLLNRRAFMSKVGTAFDLARRHDRPLALLLLDADHFKRVNDTHGHPAGDAVLVDLARIGTACLRSTDHLGRVGGEEFAILLPETDRDGAITFAERLLADIRAARVDIGGEAPLSYTVSIGIALISAETDSHETLVQRADQALYAAKSQGRDRWAMA
ncbi:diguanylate cyclase [Rhodospira trueperi]|uniref:PAS domain S-box-containing protein/diguanylate cyclase (GGDEF) domain-containing protein n=1 Tax=Rhodospira trueperi TaxID=69960 RepID=A0A1G7FEU0_9PROT|nr:diguanylate cyclase [Rhodospira trueperi]SDE74426.1 PAS domain S-box-containing protein/diguanylate cyclase (GGDEF) domain-containing protein [Rhodospira trueperi]